MSLVSLAPARAAAVAALGGVLAARPSLGQIPPPAAEPAAPAAEAASQTGPLRVWLDAGDVPLDAAALRTTLSNELRREVVLAAEPAAADVLIRLESATRAKVRYGTPAGEQLTREVELPPDHERSVQVLSWLTVNLVRDEASELLDALRARRKLEAETRAAEARAAQEKAARERAAAEKAARDQAAARGARKQADAAPPQAVASDELLRDRFKSIDVALATPVSLLPDSPKRELRLQLALAYGESGAIRGVAVSPSALRVRHDLVGVASATAFVLVGTNATGVVTGLGYTNVNGRLDGAALSVGVSDVGSTQGGVVFAGGVTLVREPSRAILVAGGANVAGDVSGAVLAAGVNVTRDIHGLALGAVNVQNRVRGVQVGIVNVADEVDGAAIGVISVSRNGRVQPVLWGSPNGPALHVALKSIAGHAFTQLGAGMDLDRTRLIYEGGAGGHVRFGKSFFVEPGLHFASSHETTTITDTPDRYYLYYLVMAGLRLGRSLDALAGLGLRHTLSGAPAEPAIRPEVRVGIGFF